MSLWDERQPKEGSRAWTAFTVYRDLGPQRSIVKAWRKQNDRQEGESSQWERWARKYHWVERAAAYDSHLDAQIRAARERKLKAIAEQLEELRGEYEVTAQKNLQELIEKQRAILLKHDPLPVTDVEVVDKEEVTVSDGVVKVSVSKKRVRGINVSRYARLSQECRASMQQAVTGVRPPAQGNEKRGSSEEGLRDLAAAIRNSPD